jgi:hypothetical protein
MDNTDNKQFIKVDNNTVINKNTIRWIKKLMNVYQFVIKVIFVLWLVVLIKFVKLIIQIVMIY